jgi:hypothetical protein
VVGMQRSSNSSTLSALHTCGYFLRRKCQPVRCQLTPHRPNSGNTFGGRRLARLKMSPCGSRIRFCCAVANAWMAARILRPTAFVVKWAA